MVESGDGARFAFEAFVELLAGGLDGNVTAKPRVAGAVNLAHAAFTKEGDDFVRAEFLASREWHLGVQSI